MENFNGLTAAETERLAILAEECGEVIQVIGKILRHGYGSSNPEIEHAVTNRELLEEELGDLAYAVRLCANRGDVRDNIIEARAKHKKTKVWKYLHHNEA